MLWKRGKTQKIRKNYGKLTFFLLQQVKLYDFDDKFKKNLPDYVTKRQYSMRWCIQGTCEKLRCSV